MHSPRPIYFLALSPPAIRLGGEVMFEGLTASTIWQAVPWGYVYAFCGGLFIALIANDLQNRRSWLRENWLSLRCPWRLAGISVANRMEPQRNCLQVRVQFKKSLTNPIMNVYGTSLVGPKVGDRTLLFSRALGDRQKDELSWQALGGIMVPHPGWTPRHSVWGYDIGPEGLESNVYPITDKQNYLVEVEILGWTYPLEARRIGNDWHFVTYHDALRIVEAA